MNQTTKDLFNTFKQFQKLNISVVFPELCGFEHGTLHAINRCNKKCEGTGEMAKVSMVAEEVHANPTQVSRALKILEERGYIKRSVNMDDRRITYVQLTDSGKEILERSTKALDAFTNKVFGQMKEDDVKKLNEYMQNLLSIASKEIETIKRERKEENKQ
ncbi:MAG: transcriptional regulator [Eubacteriales bacterium]|nr:transcriptional regulator [Eubacteriales bacterium]